MRLHLLALAVTVGWSVTARGEGEVEPTPQTSDRVISLPYAFWNENFGFAGAYVYNIAGYPQPHANLLGTVMAGTKGSGMLFLAGQNLRTFGIERLLLDPIASVGYFGQIDAFVDGNPDFSGERAGNNESDADNFISGSGWDTFFRLRLKYILPLGAGKEHVLPTHPLEKGLLAGGDRGESSYDPWSGGRTSVQLRPFYRFQKIESDDADARQVTNGLEAGLMWDNRDYMASPSRGNSLSGRVSRDWGLADSSESWTSVSSEYDQYLSFGSSPGLRQMVLALDFWTAYSPTWNVKPDTTIEHRPPAFMGASLGGLQRMRAFASQRFSDKAGIYYSAELRLIPEWNFFNHHPSLQKRMGIQWLQIVVFGELGRVAPEWDFKDLHDSMKWDAGLGVRAWAKGLVVRVDAAYSTEDLGIQMMIGQPFQF